MAGDDEVFDRRQFALRSNLFLCECVDWFGQRIGALRLSGLNSYRSQFQQLLHHIPGCCSIGEGHNQAVVAVLLNT